MAVRSDRKLTKDRRESASSNADFMCFIGQEGQNVLSGTCAGTGHALEPPLRPMGMSWLSLYVFWVRPPCALSSVAYLSELVYLSSILTNSLALEFTQLPDTAAAKSATIGNPISQVEFQLSSIGTLRKW